MRIHRAGLSGALEGTRGNALIEFALMVPVLFLILFGITEFGRALATVQVLHAAAREGARLAIVTAPDPAAVDARVTEVLAASGITPASISLEGPGAAPNSIVRVTVLSDFTVIPGDILGALSGTVTLRGESVMRYEN
jgi:Flp pilus assembly protein TadG